MEGAAGRQPERQLDALPYVAGPQPVHMYIYIYIIYCSLLLLLLLYMCIYIYTYCIILNCIIFRYGTITLVCSNDSML